MHKNLSQKKELKPNSEAESLTKNPHPCWPENKAPVPQKRFYSVKEVSKIYGISQWLLYQHIKADPTFPFVNIGLKKRLLIDIEEFKRWIQSQVQKEQKSNHQIPSFKDLMDIGESSF